MHHLAKKREVSPFELLNKDLLSKLLPYIGLAGMAKLRVNFGLDALITPIINRELHQPQVIKDFAIGKGHIVVLNELGQVFSAGRDAYYCLGHGEMGSASLSEAEKRIVQQLTRVRVNGSEIIMAPVVQVAAYDAATMLRTADDALLACGWNNSGRLGVGVEKDCIKILTPCTDFSPTSRLTDVQIGYDFSIILNEEGTGWGSGYTRSARSLAFFPQAYGKAHAYQPLTINDGINLSHLSLGHQHYLTLSSNGAALVMGNNYKGQLGVDDSDDKPLSEFNKYTQYSVKFDGVRDSFGMNQVKVVAAGCDFTFIFTVSGQLYSCGDNGDGQLALGDRQQRKLFVAVEMPALVADEAITTLACGRRHVVVVTLNGHVCAAGSNAYNAYADDGVLRAGFSDRLVQVGDIAEPIKKLLAGADTTLYLDASGVLHARGNNEVGQLATHLQHRSGFFAVQIPDKTKEWDALMAQRDEVFRKKG